MIGSALGGIGGAVGGLIGTATAPRGGKREYEQAVEAWRKLQESNFDYSALSPPELKLFGEYFPQEYTATVPQEVRLAIDSEAGRGAQLSGINYFEGIRDAGLPIETRLAAEESQRAVANQGRLGQQAILEDFQRRGRLGGGAELGARVGMDQQSMNLARDLGSDLVRQELGRRMEAGQLAAGIGSQERGQTQGLSQFNADAVNRFNQWVSQQQNQAAAANALARERTQAANVGTRQRTGESNILNRYGTQLENLTRQNALRNQLFGQQATKAGGLSGSLQALGNQRDMERAAHIRQAQQMGQGIGQGIGGIGDILGGGGLLGGGIQSFY